MGQGGSLKRNQKYIEVNENENTRSQNFRDRANTERDIYRTMCMHQKRGKVSDQ